MGSSLSRIGHDAGEVKMCARKARSEKENIPEPLEAVECVEWVWARNVIPHGGNHGRNTEYSMMTRQQWAACPWQWAPEFWRGVRSVWLKGDRERAAEGHRGALYPGEG